MKNFATCSIAAAAFLVVGTGFAQLGTSTQREIEQVILEGSEYAHKNLSSRPDDISKDGSLEFWSSGGLLHEIAAGAPPEYYESFSLKPKHIKVITLVEGKAAVAQYYSEGSMKPKGSAEVAHYLTRVTEVYVNEGGQWKVRAAHYSPVTGGSGTSQASVTTD